MTKYKNYNELKDDEYIICVSCGKELTILELLPNLIIPFSSPPSKCFKHRKETRQ